MIFELILSITILIESLILSYITVKRIFAEGDFLPILTRWSKAFSFTAFSSILVVAYIIFRMSIQEPNFQMGTRLWSVHFAVSTMILAFQGFACFEFFKTAVLIRNTKKIKRRYMTKSQDYFIEVLVHVVYALSFIFFFNKNTDFFTVGSGLLEAENTGFSGFDLYSNLLLSATYLLQYFIIPRDQNKLYTVIKYVLLLFSIQNLLEVLNILFTNSSSQLLTLIGYILLSIGFGILSFNFIRKLFIDMTQKK